MNIKILVVSVILLLSILSAGCFDKNRMSVESPDFSNGGMIPKKYTCDGENINPPLNFSNIPKNAKSLVVIMEDPDAPGGKFIHWMIWNIPANVKELKYNEDVIYPQGKNDFGKIGYEGPCPPKGSIHRYYFKVFALDTFLSIKEGSTKNELIRSMSGHIICESLLVGKYER